MQPQVTWGWFGTLLWTAAIGLVFLIAQAVAAVIYISVSQQVTDPSQLDNFEQLAQDGDVLSVATWASAIVCGLLVLVAVSSKPGAKAKQYLALFPVSWRIYAAGVVATIGLILVIEFFNLVFNRPVPALMVDMYRSADHRLLFWLAIVVAAPVFEEIFFRGFLHSGLQHTSVGVSGTIVITAAFWAVIHAQYEAFEVGIIFFMGLVLGLARWLTGSIYIPIVIHGLNNFVSTVQVSYITSQTASTALSFSVLP